MKYILILFFFCLSFLINTPQVFAQKIPQQTFFTATVKQVVQQGTQSVNGMHTPYQVLSVTLLSGPDQGKTITITSGKETTLTASQIATAGETIVLTKVQNPNGKSQYQVYDTYRINYLLYLTLAFVLLVILIAGIRGGGSLLGLFVSLAIIFLYIVPHILSGANPLSTSIIGSLVILFLTTYLAHGISKQTTVALCSTFLALMLTAWISSLFVSLAHLTGYNEEASTLQFGATSMINLKGLLLGGIIIGTLGALNDVTTTQAAAVFELAKTDTKLTLTKLFRKGFGIGKEHVASMVNTLVLAYAGSSLALFLFLILNPQKMPWWVILNSEDISDEIIRTLAGGMGLILVVPIVTLLAALVCNDEVKAFFHAIIHILD